MVQTGVHLYRILSDAVSGLVPLQTNAVKTQKHQNLWRRKCVRVRKKVVFSEETAKNRSGGAFDHFSGKGGF